MHSASGRLMGRALLGLGLLVAAANPATAQSAIQPANEPAVATGIDIDYASAVAPLVSTSEPRPARNASFLRQGGAANEDSGIGIGVLGMITRSSVELDAQFFDIEARTGWGVGLWVGGNRNGRVGFVGEFIYAVHNSEDELGNEYQFKVFQIPAVLHLNIGSRSRNSVGGYIVAGPSFSFNLGEEFNGSDFGQDFSGATIGMIAGAGLEFFRIGIEGRGNWDLNEISDEGAFEGKKGFTFELLGKFAFN